MGITSKRVKCVETDETWNSIKECAKAIGVSNACLSGKIRFREPINGRHYEKSPKMYRDANGEWQMAFNTV